MLDANKEKRELIDGIAKERGLKPFTVNNSLARQSSSVDERKLPSIESWFRGFYDAEMVVTDSFHACVFSIIFGKPFVVVGNENRGLSRFHSLFRYLHIDCKPISTTVNYVLECTIKEAGIEKMRDIIKGACLFIKRNAE